MISKNKKIVITGVGMISPLGFNTEEVWSALINKQLSLEEKAYCVDGEKIGNFWIHKVKEFDINNFGIEKNVLDYIKEWKQGKTSKILEQLLAAVKLALDDSKVVYDPQKNDVGAFVTVEHPDFDYFCENLVDDIFNDLRGEYADKKKKEVLEKIYRTNVNPAYDLHTFMYLYFINRVFNFHGYSLFVNNACASGLYALEAAANYIKNSNAKIAIIAAGDDGCNFYKYRWFNDRGLYSNDGMMRPFSEDANGFVVGEGTSAIVIEDYEHALSRNANIYGEYVGGSFSVEAWKVIYPNVSDNSYYNCISDVLEKTAVSQNDIDLINPHGVGLKITDLYEARALNEIFSDSRNCAVTALKPYIGHNLGGSALLESILTLISMTRDTVLPNLNCENPVEELKVILPKAKAKKEIHTALKTACGFAGYNAAAIFKKV